MSQNQIKKLLPKSCPACSSTLRVHALCCRDCGTKIEGDYVLPSLLRLSEDDQSFVVDFVLCSGSLKEMAAKMGLSYPSVRNRLDDVIAELGKYNK